MMQIPSCVPQVSIIKDSLALWVPVASAVVGALSAWLAYRTYGQSLKIKRAESLVALHKGFFVDKTYDDVRKDLDAETEQERVRRDALVLPPGPNEAFINFLNWFELIAYLQKLGIYEPKDMEALFGYYLRLLKQPGPVYTYICDSQSDFQYLKELLGKLPV